MKFALTNNSEGLWPNKVELTFVTDKASALKLLSAAEGIDKDRRKRESEAALAVARAESPMRHIFNVSSVEEAKEQIHRLATITAAPQQVL